jgi:hypothetical protein
LAIPQITQISSNKISIKQENTKLVHLNPISSKQKAIASITIMATIWFLEKKKKSYLLEILFKKWVK